MLSLKSYTTFGLNVNCASVHTFSDIPSFFAFYHAAQTSYILGGGSNSIFTQDFEGTILVNQIKGVDHYETASHHYLRVGAGENWHELVSLCTENQWFGLENLALIPGSVGACPIQNIGAYGSEVNRYIKSVEVVMLKNSEKRLLTNEECEFGYRDSVFKHALRDQVLITHVNFSLPKHYPLETSYGELASLTNPSPETIYQKVIEIRTRKLPDPDILGNAGSFFKNPVIEQTHYNAIADEFEAVPHYSVGNNKIKLPAAWLIEKVGYKGKTLNDVRCHPTQPLVLTNLGEARGEDVIQMARAIMDKVVERFGVTLEPEVRLVGKNGLIKL